MELQHKDIVWNNFMLKRIIENVSVHTLKHRKLKLFKFRYLQSTLTQWGTCQDIAYLIIHISSTL